MATINVSTTAALNTALKAAKAGDTILLSTGTYALTATKLNFASDVTIASADASRPAALTSIAVTDTTGLTMRDLELKATPAAGSNSFRVTDSEDIHFMRVSVHGSLDGDPRGDMNGLLIRGSRNVSVEDSEFQDLGHGISHLNSSLVTIARNEFHHLKVDGVRGGGSSDVTITANLFRDFHPGGADHPDAIQFWTTNTTTIARNIVITDNAFIRGDGAPVQGIFLRDQEGDLPYEKVLISGNVVAGATYNGIMVNGARDVTVTDNLVQGFSDRKSWIRLQDVSTATVSGNSTSHLIFETSINVTTLANTTLALATDDGAWAFAQWMPVATAVVDPRILGDAANNALMGTGGDDTILGRGGADTLSGGAGDDVLRGGADPDRFAFEAGSGRDRIADFGPGDTIYARGLFSAERPASLVATGDNVTIHFDAGDSIVLTNTSMSELQATATGWIFGHSGV